MLNGYARVSTFEQSLDLQTGALERADCERLFTDQVGGARAERPGLDQVLSPLRMGDTLVVRKLDRLGRSDRHLIETVTTTRPTPSPISAGRSGSAGPPSTATSPRAARMPGRFPQ